MNKTAIKNFAIWARNKLIADITYKAGLLGITEKAIKSPLPQSTKDVQFFDIGTKEPYSISGIEIKQREALVTVIRNKEQQADYSTAYKAVIEEVAYTWFNRLIAVRFLEVNDYLPSRIRVLSSEGAGKDEPDLVTNPFDTNLEFTPYENDRIMQLKNDNQLDELFRILFIKQCNALNVILPNLFEKTSDYTELLLNVAFTDKDGLVYHLVHDILEDDFNVSKEGQVEIIGWLYQYYNVEPKALVDAYVKKGNKVIQEDIPAKTQLFTRDWVVRYMVENSLGRLWLEGHTNDVLQSEWKYYLDEVEQEADVQKQLDAFRREYKAIKPEDIKVIDPAMGSGHILVYAFDVLMQIYESYGYSQRDAAKSIIENNLYGLDIDNRAYQLSYFAVMMKARQYNRRILNGENHPHVYAIQESNAINRDQLQYFGAGMNEMQRNIAMLQIHGLLDTFIDAKEYGSILDVDSYDWQLLHQFVDNIEITGQLSFDTVGVEDTQFQVRLLVEIGAIMASKYDVVVTNPPYLGNGDMNARLDTYIQNNFADVKTDLFAVFIVKCSKWIKHNRYLSMVTMQSWMTLGAFESLRKKICSSEDIIFMLHLDDTLSGISYQTVVFTLASRRTTGYAGNYTFIGKQEYRGTELNVVSESIKKKLIKAQQDEYSKLNGCPIAYSLGTKAIESYISAELLSAKMETREGMTTGNNDLFLRLWHEIDNNKMNVKWFPYNKGGEYRKWYGNNEYLVNWENDGYEIRKFKDLDTGRIRSHNYNGEFAFRKGITWSAFSSRGATFRYSNEQFLFDSKGSKAFCADIDLMYILAFLNGIVSQHYLCFFAGAKDKKPGHIISLPYIGNQERALTVSLLAEKNVKMAQNDWDSFEYSWDFIKHPLLRGTSTIIEAFDQWQKFTEAQFSQSKANEEDLNRIFIEIYNLQEELTSDVDDKDVTIRKADLGRDIRSFLSYAVGCMFGRYSLDVDSLVYAGGQWDNSKYSTFIPDTDNIIPITDEEYFEDDIVGLFCAFVKKVYGTETLEENLVFIAQALGNKGNTSREIIRNYFVKDFFKDHCKVYQKRPIYWLFDSGKADGFKALIYMHRYDENTIGNLRIDYLHKMQRIYEREIVRMQETIANSTNAREVAAAEKRKDKLIKQLKETKNYDEKIAHLALTRIDIDLDDGVKVNYEKVQTGTDGKKLEVLAKI